MLTDPDYFVLDISGLLQNSSLPCPHVKGTAIRKDSASG